MMLAGKEQLKSFLLDEYATEAVAFVKDLVSESLLVERLQGEGVRERVLFSVSTDEGDVVFPLSLGDAKLLGEILTRWTDGEFLGGGR